MILPVSVVAVSDGEVTSVVVSLVDVWSVVIVPKIDIDICYNKKDIFPK